MEELAIKIAEMLDISVQGAIDMYPVIRSQYIWYAILTSVTNWATVIGFVSLILTGVTLFIRFDLDKVNWRTGEIEEDWAIADKVFKKVLLALILSAVVGIVTSAIIPFLAPDIMIITDFLG